MKQKIALGIILAMCFFIGLFVIFNFNYFQKNISYYLGGRKTVLLSNSGSTDKKQVLGPPNHLSIFSLGIDAPVVYATGTTETNFQANLKNGVVHYPGTAQPGAAGNCYIFGHSSDYLWSDGHYKTVFAILPKIKTGDTIQISNNRGQVFSYVVFETKVVSPSDIEALDQDYSKKILTLQTSWPVGTALKRFLVLAELKNPTSPYQK